MFLPNSKVQIAIDVVGETTGHQWQGLFQVKVFLSHRDTLTQNRIRKELLGARPNESDPQSFAMAEFFSKFAVHIVEAPSWWKDADNGMEMVDWNVIQAIYDAILAEEKKHLEAIKAQADKAKIELKDLKVTSEQPK